MVESLYGMIYGPHAGSQPKLCWRVSGIIWIIKNHANAHSRCHKSSLHAVGLRVSPASCAFGGAERGRYCKMGQVMSRFLVHAKGDGFRRIDGGAAADRYDGVDGGVIRDYVHGLVNFCYWPMLLYVGEGAGVVRPKVGF